MKKYHFLLPCLLFSIGAHCQSFGLKAGVNVATISGPSDAGNRIVFHIGAWGLFKPSDKIGIMPEIVYSMQGCSIKNSDSKVNTNYLNVPILLNYYFNENMFFQAGPQIGFLMSANVSDPTGSSDIKDYLASTDIGGAIGLGGIWDKFLLNARYTFGFTDTVPDAANKSLFGVSGSLTHAVFQLSLGYKLQ